jgi:Cu(I)/Ag(I) efflux system membrane protein CusA/SilA
MKGEMWSRGAPPTRPDLGLVPIMWSTGTGADVMKRIAAPMIGGIFTSFVLELAVYPTI